MDPGANAEAGAQPASPLSFTLKDVVLVVAVFRKIAKDLATNDQGAWDTKTAWKNALQMRLNALQMRLKKLELGKERGNKKKQIKLLNKKLQLVESEPPGGEFPVLVLDKNALVV